MARGAFFSSSIAIVFIGVAVYAAAGPVQGATSNMLQRDEYASPVLADVLARYWEERRARQGAKRNLDQIGGGHLVRDTDQQLRRFLDVKDDRLMQSLDPVDDKRILDAIGAGTRNLNGIGDGHLPRQAHRGFDSLSRTPLGESKRFAPLRRFGSIYQRPGNFDEIDRSVFDHFTKRNIDEIDTAFDSFFKRNFDEIDRVGWSGFVKRLDNYLAERQRR